VAAFEAALVRGQGVQHPLLRVDEQRCAVLAGQCLERDAFDVQGAVALRDVRLARKGRGGGGGGHLRGSVVLPAGALAAAAGALAAAAGAVAASLDEEDLRLSGVISCGKVARPAAAGSVGRYSGPRCPQATSPAAPATRQTMSAARGRVLTRIWRTFNIAKL
jgi:hypothetical protein